MADNTKRRKIDRVGFLSEHVMALKEAIHPDIIVKPGDKGPGIPSHKAVLVRSFLTIYITYLEYYI